MIYKPRMVAKMWDTWMYHDGNTYFLYYLVTEHSPGEGVCLATSKDGVHWEEVGLILPLANDAQWLGTGSVWKALVPEKASTYVMNFSEWRGPGMREGQQTIFFAESTDLVHWTRLDNNYEFRPDPQWYRVNEGNNSRWDCIYTVPRSGGLYGYWTANPGAFHPGFGFGETDDGVHWRALPPPTIEWGGVVPMKHLEVGAVEKIDQTYHAMLGSYSPYLTHSMGMFLFTADEPDGPFRPAQKNYELLTSPKHQKMSYFSRFFPLHGEILVNHHVMTRGDTRFFAPLKTARVDEDGVLRLCYWQGNDCLKGESRPVSLPERYDTLLWPLAVAFLEETFDFQTGFILEGALVDLSQELTEGSSSPGFYIEHTPGAGTAINIRTNGVADFITVSVAEMRVEREEQVDRAVPPQPNCRVRLLVRGSLLELYLDDVLIQCFSLPETTTGRIGLLSGGTKGKFETLMLHGMTLEER